MNGLEKSYMFRIKFQTPESEALDIQADNEVQIELQDNLKIILKALSVEENKNSIYVINGGPFASEEEAQEIAINLTNLVLLHFANIGRGVSFQSFGPITHITEAGKEYFRKMFKLKTNNIYPDNFGITIYKIEEDAKFLSSNMRFVVTGSVEKLKESIEKKLYLNLNLNERELLTLEMFTSSFFEKTNSAKFLKLMICIESLLDVSEKDNEIKDMIDHLIEYVNKSKMDDLKRNSLSSAIGKLKKESITEAGVRLSNEYLLNRQYHNMNPGDFFKHCYSLRSDLLHNGNISPEVDNVFGDLVNFAGDIIKAKIIR